MLACPLKDSNHRGWLALGGDGIEATPQVL